jgi:hypothetical protein
MTDSSGEDAVALADPQLDLHELCDRIGRQSVLLKSHAQELDELRAALLRLDEQIDAHQRETRPNAAEPALRSHSQ